MQFSSPKSAVQYCALVLLLMFAGLLRAQTDPNLAQGLKPYGAYHGSDIDVVSIENGKVDLHIPLLSYPQRGNLQMSFTARFNSPNLRINQFCPPPPPNLPCNYTDEISYPSLVPAGAGVSVVADQGFLTTTSGVITGTTYAFPIIAQPDGSMHNTGIISGTTNYRTTDASGWLFSAPTNFGNGTAISPDGTRYSMSSGVVSSVEDTNGNKITTNFTGSTRTGWTDSVGRIIPVPPNAYAGGAAGNSANCPTQYLSVIAAYAWNVPAPNGGTDTYTFCYASTPVYFYLRAPGSTGTTTAYQGNTEVLQSIVLPNGLSWSFTYDALTDLAEIITPTGGTISYTYPSTPNQMCVWGGNYPQNYVSDVTSRTVNANDGTGSHTWNYGLALGQQGQVLNPLTSTVTDPAGNDTVYTMTPLGGTCRYYQTQAQKYQGSSGSGTLLETVATIYSYNIDPYQPNGQVIFEAVVNAVPTTITTTRGSKTKKIQKTYDSGFSYFDSSVPGLYGKVMSESEYDYGTGGNAGSILRRTVYNYQAFVSSSYLTYNILDPEASDIIYDSTANTCKGVAGYCAYTYFGYDEVGLQSSGITTQHDSSPVNGTFRGNQTSAHKWLNGSTVSQSPCAVSVSNGYLVSNKVFFDTGEVQSSSDPCGFATTYLYSSTYAGSLPTTITNPLSQATVNTYDFNTGLIASTKDPNLQTTTYTYDPSWRPLGVSYPDGENIGYSYNDSIPASVTVTKLIKTGTNLVETGVVDGLGRLQQSQLVDPDCHSTNGLVYTDYSYGFNTTGAYTSVSNPYCQTSDTTYGATTKTLDALGRVSNVAEADSSTVSTTYTDNCSTTTDEVGNARQSCLDGLDRMTSVLEDPGTSPHLNYETDYVYDVLGDLTSVTQKGSNSANARVRTFQYDSLSQLTSAQNPESGTIIYGYDADGEAITRKAPSPNQPSNGTSTVTTTYTYDKLNRLTGKSYSDTYASNPATAAAKFGYDGTALTGCNTAPPSLTDTLPIGRRTAMCDGSGATSWTHDPLGRDLVEKRNIDGQTQSITYTYNKDGSLATLTYPGTSKVITYAVSAAGRHTAAQDLVSSINYVQSATYAPPGELAGMVNGQASGFGGIVTSNAYNNRLQPILLSAAVSGQSPVFSECFDFHLGVAITQPSPCSFASSALGDNGNVDQIVNNRDNTRTQTFTYDVLNRIASAQSSGSQWGETFTIDSWGNMTTETGISGKTHSESLNVSVGSNNQFTTASGFTYDAAGNMATNGSTTYKYDAENRLNNTGGYTYYYDGDGNRVAKSNGSTGTLYWRGPTSDPISESNLTGTTQAEYIFFDARRVARRDVSGNVVHYYFSDHLGSHGVVENATATACEQDIDYYPFGAVSNDYCPSVTQHYRFNGKERDTESGLDNFGARYVASSLGRFMTPDWAVKPTNVPYAHFGNPQTLNLYSYVENNPTTTGDPDGHGDVWDFATGAANAILSDNLLGAGRLQQTSTAGKIGQGVGDFVATVQGGAEALLGGGVEVGGVALDSTGVGAIVGVPANVVGAGLMLHGGATAATGFGNLFKNGMAPKKGESGGPGAGKNINDKTKGQALEENKTANGGEAKCVFCGEKVGEGTENKINYDHAQAKAKGGNDTLNNTNVTCEYCNKSKGTGPTPKNPKKTNGN